MLGGLGLEGPEGALRGPPVQRKRLALLALLALAPETRLSREKLAAYLWPESSSDRARHQVSSALYELRKVAGDGAILAVADELRLDPDALDVDVLEFRAAIDRGDFEGAVTLYRGPLLDGFFLSDALAFERWVDQERDRVARAYARALETLGEAAGERGDFGAALGWWKTRAALDPYDSRVALRLMLAFEADGNRAGAIQHAAIHERLLQDGLGVESAPEVRALAERLRGETVAPSERVAPSEPALPPDRVPPHGPVGPHGSVLEPGSGTPADPIDPQGPGPADAVAVVPGPGGPEAFVAGPRAPGAGVPAPPRPRPILTTAPWVGVALATGFLAASMWNGQGSAAERSPLALVAPFENRTGDPALDPLGQMASDLIAQEVWRTGAAQVAMASSPIPVPPFDSVPSLGSRSIDSLRERARGTGAAVVVSGAYYQVRDSIQFHAWLTDGTGSRVLRWVEPIRGGFDEGAAAERLGRRVASALAVLLDTRLAAIGNLASPPANFEAFQACLEGLEAFFASDWALAIRHFERSMELDPAYAFPLLHIGLVRLNMGDLAGADSAVQRLHPYRQDMSDFERGALDLLAAYVAENPVAAYEAAGRATRFGPGSPPNVQWGAEALRLKRPREAIRILSAIDPEAAPVGGWPLYWASLTGARHALGQHWRELRVARRARKLYPDEPWSLFLEARALAALGRVHRLEALVALRRSLPDARAPRQGPLMVALAEELKVHGRSELASRLLEEAIAWYRDRPAEEQAGADHRRELGLALLSAGRPEEAQRLLRGVLDEDPTDPGALGALGVVAALVGREAEAEQLAGLLSGLDLPYRVGEPLLWRACVAAHRGDPVSALSLLQQAAVRGAGFEHSHVCLDPLRESADFREHMRPKG